MAAIATDGDDISVAFRQHPNVEDIQTILSTFRAIINDHVSLIADTTRGMYLLTSRAKAQQLVDGEIWILIAELIDPEADTPDAGTVAPVDDTVAPVAVMEGDTVEDDGLPDDTSTYSFLSEMTHLSGFTQLSAEASDEASDRGQTIQGEDFATDASDDEADEEDDKASVTSSVASIDAMLETISQLDPPPTYHIPRPRNSWIMYRQAMSSGLRAQAPHLTAAEVSRLLGEAWAVETDEVRAYYQDLAAREAAEHRADFPNYVYIPGKKARMQRRQLQKLGGDAFAAAML